MKKRVNKKSHPYQLWRYVSLFMVLLFFIAIPVFNWYSNLKIGYNQARLVELAQGYWAGRLYAFIDLFYSLWDNPVQVASSNNGSLWAFSIFGLPFSDPLGVLSEVLHAVRVPWDYLLGVIIPLIFIFTLGRVFCSWICPMVLLFEITSKIRGFLLKMKIPLMDIKIDKEVSMVLFWLGMVASAFTGAWVWHFILPYITFSHEIFSYIVFSSFTVGIYVLVAVLAVDIALIPGQFCRSVCPTGFFLSWLGKIRVFQLRVDETKCPPSCKLCQKKCDIDLFPRVNQVSSCHLCMKCVEGCPVDNIKLINVFPRRNS
jgi:ferredoxin-type protein NapH